MTQEERIARIMAEGPSREEWRQLPLWLKVSILVRVAFWSLVANVRKYCGKLRGGV
jgi:hypothetical protein